MRFLQLDVRNFRNLEQARIECGPNLTAVIGENGQGKTNTLEALYFVAGLRPLRNVQRKALVRTGATDARLQLSVHRERTGLTHELRVDISSGRRHLSKDRKKVDTASFVGTAVAVAFTPDDLSVSKGGPDGRRRFLDRAIFNHQPAYLGHALRYGRALKERNRLLAEGAADGVLEAYDDVVAAEGAEIAVRRHRFVEDVVPQIRERFRSIADPAPPLEVRLRASVTDLGATTVEAARSALRQALSDRRGTDRRRRKTTVGPHLDDLELLLDGHPARDRASQGQHRALALALKLAELTHLSQKLEEPPVLLLDDMSSELDDRRSQNLFACVREIRGQVILTSTAGVEAVRRILGAPSDLVAYRMQGGEVSRIALTG
jgi:DNA replication and repair protein RecF